MRDLGPRLVDAWCRLLDLVRRWLAGAESWLLSEPRALYGVAACRIGMATAVLGLLVTNFSTRQVWAGQASIWAEPARAISQFPEIALLDGVSGDVLTLFYLVTMLAAVLLLVGWHAKAANVVTLIGFIAIVAQNPVVADESDNLIRITLLWLLLMQSSERWSLDAWRRERRGNGSGGAARAARSSEEVLPEWLSRGLHHVGLLGLATPDDPAVHGGGLDKVSQKVWQQGTALYSTMQLPEFRPFPGLSDRLSGSTVLLALLTYAVLLTQLFFAPLLLNPISRRIVITATIVVNVLVAVLLALPWSSLACLALVALFVSTESYARFDEWLRGLFAPVGDWFALRGYDVQDAWFAVADRTVYPVGDWVRSTILRR
ncbi:HTTM domain-containing protein [Aeromicrobium sp. UC242_57]|uniref:HTTM domain-containing protein n=1 Tax=Aeromicrobium sp. UC242_57 TaxID=3374624 RepID=UPI0037ADA4EF